MKTPEQLAEELDSVLWDTLNMIADAYEERGISSDDEMAYGFRTLARLKKIPMSTNHAWGWSGIDSPVFAPKAGHLPGSLSHLLPREVLHRIYCIPDHGCHPGTFRTLAKAYRVAAWAIGMYQNMFDAEDRP